MTYIFHEYLLGGHFVFHEYLLGGHFVFQSMFNFLNLNFFPNIEPSAEQILKVNTVNLIPEIIQIYKN